MVSTRSSTRAATAPNPPDPPTDPSAPSPSAPRRNQRKRPPATPNVTATPRTRASARLAKRRAKTHGTEPVISPVPTEIEEDDLVPVEHGSQKATGASQNVLHREGGKHGGREAGEVGRGGADDSVPSDGHMEVRDQAVGEAAVQGFEADKITSCAEPPLLMKGEKDGAAHSAPILAHTSSEPTDRDQPTCSRKAMRGGAVETAPMPGSASGEHADCAEPPPSKRAMEGEADDIAIVPQTLSNEPTDCIGPPRFMGTMQVEAVNTAPASGPTPDEPTNCVEPPPSNRPTESEAMNTAPVAGTAPNEPMDFAQPPPPVRAAEDRAFDTAPAPGPSSDEPTTFIKSPPSRGAIEGGAVNTAPAPGPSSVEPADLARTPFSVRTMEDRRATFEPAAVPVPNECEDLSEPSTDKTAIAKTDKAAEPQALSENLCSGAEQAEVVNDRKLVGETVDVNELKSTAVNLTPSKAGDSDFAIGDISKFAANPAAFLRRDPDISRRCRDKVSRSFCAQSKAEFGNEISQYHLVPKKRGKGLPPMGPLLDLDVAEHLDCDQLWEGIDMRNDLLLPYLEERIQFLQSKMKNRKRPKKRKKMIKKAQKLGDGQSGHISSEVDALLQGRDHTASQKKVTIREKDGRDDGKTVLINNVAASGVHDFSPQQQSAKQRQNVRFAPGTKDKAEDERPITDWIEDGFFNLADMELFADDAEQLARQGKLVASDDESDDSNLDEKNESESGYELNFTALKNLETSRRTEKLRYSDFFDPPSAEVAGSKAGRVSELLGATDEDAVDELEEETPLVASRSRMRRLIDAMEEENVGKKPWQLRGEVSGFSRPKDSLLETNMDYDITVDPRSVMENDRTGTIENLIRQRIVDGLFDDVIPPLPEDYDMNKKKKASELPEISQEKPTEGLADLYEREFLNEKEKAKNESKSAEVRKARDKKTEVEETEQQKEVSRLFDKLASKLDVLSGLHFTPGPTKATEEMAVSGDIKALASEEAIPEAVSEESLRTAREVYSVDKKKLAGDLEKTRRDRRAAHRRNKRGIKKANEARARAARLMEQANPALGEKRRAEEALRRRGKKVRVAQPDARVLGPKVIQGPLDLGPSR